MKALLTKLTKQELILLGAVAVYVSVHFTQSMIRDFTHHQGFDLLINLALSCLFPAGMLYAVTQRDLWWRCMLMALVAFEFIADAILLGLYVYNVGVAVTFTDPTIALRNWLNLAEVLLCIPVLILAYPLFKPLYDERKRIKAMSDIGLVTHYVNGAREGYRHWMAREIAMYDREFQTLSTIFYEMKKRDPALKGLYTILKEPDDWVRITAARQLLGRKDGMALQTLDSIGNQNSEWSAYAKRMATDWRNGKLKAWT